MNTVMKEQIISEMESLPDQKAHSLLDYLHFLKQDSQNFQPNDETIEALKEDKSRFPTYNSTVKLFESLKAEIKDVWNRNINKIPKRYEEDP